MSILSTNPVPAISGEDRQTHRLWVNAIWLVRLRWVAVCGQLLTIGVSLWSLRVELAATPLLAIVAFTAATNVGFAFWSRRLAGRPSSRRPGAGRRLLACIMLLDLMLLTGLLYFAGGPRNPFAVFYFVNLSLSAVVLPVRWSGMLAGVAIVSFAALFFFHVDVPELSQPVELPRLHPGVTLGQLGFLVGLAATAGVVIYFIARVTRELQSREIELRLAEQKRARSERLEALATLAAGAGHELATPLSTIAVVANELTKHLQGADVPEEVRQDVALIRRELDHCRSILNRMSGSAGQAAGEEVAPVSVERLMDEVLEGLRRPPQVRMQLDPDTARQAVMAPLEGLSQAIRGVVQNALDAASSSPKLPGRGRVDVLLQAQQQYLQIEVHDDGPGMPANILARAGEPFFTTKDPGQGMGLGLFLTRSVVERLGGRIKLTSTVGIGTRVMLQIPLEKG